MYMYIYIYIYIYICWYPYRARPAECPFAMRRAGAHASHGREAMICLNYNIVGETIVESPYEDWRNAPPNQVLASLSAGISWHAQGTRGFSCE